MYVILKQHLSSSCFIEALNEKKQTIMTKDSIISSLQAQVEATSAEKDTLIAKYETIVKESEGENIKWYETH